MQPRRPLAAVCLGLLLVACGGSPASQDTAKLEVARADSRLEGNWTLVEFQPARPLEPMFAALLASQLNQLTITLNDGSLTAYGVGVSAERTYRVTQAAADGFSATIVDPTNVEYRVTGAFQGNELAFTCHSDPWRGSGRLRRMR